MGLALVGIAACAATGVAVGSGHAHEATLILGGLAAATLVVAVLYRLLASLSLAAFAVVGAGVLFMNSDALHITLSITVSDALMVLAVPLLALLFITGGLPLRIPGWLVIGGGLIAASALLVELFPPHSLQAQIFQNTNLKTHEVEDLSNPILAGRFLVAIVAVPLVVAGAATTWGRWRALVNAWLIGAAASSFVAVLAFVGLDLQQTLAGTDYAIHGYGGAAERFVGLAVHPTLLGVTGAMAAPLVLVRIVNGARARFYAPLIALYAGAVLISGSRWAFLALVVGSLAVFATQPRTRRHLLALFAAGLVLAFAFGLQSASLSSLQRLIGGEDVLNSVSTSDNGRELVIGQGLHYFLDRPIIGSGFRGIRGAHNVALEVLSSGGLIAFAGYALIIGGAIALGSALRARLPEDLSNDALGLVVSLWVLLFIGLATNASLDRFLYLPVGLLIGMASLWYRDRGAAAPTAPSG